MPLRTGLRRMLDDLGLTYVIENEVLLVTTKEAAEAKLTPVIYPVTDLSRFGARSVDSLIEDDPIQDSAQDLG